MKSLSLRLSLMLASLVLLHSSCNTTSSLTSLLGSNPNLSGITSLIKGAGGIGSLLGGSGGSQPYTLLAPTNDALASLGTGAVQNLLKPENKSQLTDLLKQQVIPGNVTEDALKSGSVKNLAGNAVNLGTTALGQGMKSKDGGLIYVVNSLLGK